MVAAETATSCPLEFTWASTQTMASSARAATGGDVGARLAGAAPVTRFAGACANTKMLPLVPTSCGRNCICAEALTTTWPMSAVTVSGDWGGGGGVAERRAVNDPPLWGYAGPGWRGGMVIAPVVPSQVAVYP